MCLIYHELHPLFSVNGKSRMTGKYQNFSHVSMFTVLPSAEK